MCTGTLLNITGLVIGVIAAGLMYYFPPRVQQYTSQGEAIVTWLSSPDGEKKHVGKWQIRLTRIGPILLACSFLLQLIGAFLTKA
mgnify:CR=1 FL=1